MKAEIDRRPYVTNRFIRLWAQKLGMKFRRKLLPSALFKENIKKKNILKYGILPTT